MSKRNANYRLVRIHRTYTVEEAAMLFDVHKNTVRAWLKAGLPACDTRRPTLILGNVLASFLRARRVSNKHPCKPGEMYCFRCRTPRLPAGNMADYEPKTDRTGDLVGICPVCSTMMYRRASFARLAQSKGNLEICLRRIRNV